MALLPDLTSTTHMNTNGISRSAQTALYLRKQHTVKQSLLNGVVNSTTSVWPHYAQHAMNLRVWIYISLLLRNGSRVSLAFLRSLFHETTTTDISTTSLTHEVELIKLPSTLWCSSRLTSIKLEKKNSILSWWIHYCWHHEVIIVINLDAKTSSLHIQLREDNRQNSKSDDSLLYELQDQLPLSLLRASLVAVSMILISMRPVVCVDDFRYPIHLSSWCVRRFRKGWYSSMALYRFEPTYAR